MSPKMVFEAITMKKRPDTAIKQYRIIVHWKYSFQKGLTFFFDWLSYHFSNIAKSSPLFPNSSILALSSQKPPASEDVFAEYLRQ